MVLLRTWDSVPDEECGGCEGSEVGSWVVRLASLGRRIRRDKRGLWAPYWVFCNSLVVSRANAKHWWRAESRETGGEHR